MSDKPPTPSANPSAAAKQPSTKPTYISSSGQTLTALPLTARLHRATDTVYNFLGLYFVSLLSLDPYAAAQNSRFNTRGPGRNVSAGAGTGSAARQGGGVLGGGRGVGGGSGPSGGSGGGRRLATVDDVRGPECGSCG